MDFKAVIKFINSNEKFIITAHETPDGDAIGSEYAMLCAFKKLGKTAKIFNSDPTPENFKFVDASNEVNILKKPKQLPKDIEEYVLLILDVNDTGNIGSIATYVLPKVKKHFIIDHHEYEDNIGDNYIQNDASSTAEILYQLFICLKVKIDFNMANALFVAIVYDTGSFIYPKTSAITFKIAYELMKIGVHPNEVYKQVYECRSISFLVLQSKVLSTLELKYKNHIAILTMTNDIIMDSGAKYDEGQQLINIPLASESVKVSIFFKENTEGILRCSLRSKGNIDVAFIAHKFGGGGHKTAAGFKCKSTIKNVKKEVLKLLKPIFFNN